MFEEDERSETHGGRKNVSLELRIDRLENIYRRMDSDTMRFRLQSGLSCPPGCARCCHSARIFATVFELMAAARELYRQGTADHILDCARDREDEGDCLLLIPDASLDGKGRCRLYAWRPSLCRLFGFAAVKDKHGRAAFARCRHMPSSRVAFEMPVSAAPFFTAYRFLLADLDPGAPDHAIPINQALLQALNRYGLYAQMSSNGPPCSPSPRKGRTTSSGGRRTQRRAA